MTQLKARIKVMLPLGLHGDSTSKSEMFKKKLHKNRCQNISQTCGI